VPERNALESEKMIVPADSIIIKLFFVLIGLPLTSVK
jgi:hypothetical protein